ncbi:MAG TPA: hypothetical protein VMP67_04485 [Candidatus Limnocylindria bacterium]|nr:hypothetical protein [Candidatus Limnocylindria bacterium]
MKLTAQLVLLAIAGALFVLAALNIGIENLDFVALGLAFFAASFAAERMTTR